MELKNAINAIMACETFVDSTKTNVSVDDLMVLSEINYNISENLDFVRRWLNNDVTFDDYVASVGGTDETMTTKPKASSEAPWLSISADAEWRPVFDMNLMVSSYGHIWDIYANKELEKLFIDGDLRVILGKNISRDSRRAAPIITRAFQIRSPDRTADFIIGFRDGDRRNLRIDNLFWKKPEADYIETRVYLIEDICRRIIEHDGDVDAIFERYHDSRPSVSRSSIQQIIEKKIYTDISDMFFAYDNGKVYPRTDSLATDINAKQDGLDISGFFLMSNDKKVTGDLLRDKIKRGDTLTINEKVIIVFMAMDVIGVSKANDVKKISNVIKNTFGCDIGFDFIDQVRNDYTSEISSMFRGEVK